MELNAGRARAPRSRVHLAIVADSMTPYRTSLHRRIDRELPEVMLSSLFTHEFSNSAWMGGASEQVRPVFFGPGQLARTRGEPRHALREWRKGGRVIRWLRENAADAALVLGYGDPGRLRIIEWCRAKGVPCFLFGDSNVLCDRPAGWRRWLKAAVVSRAVRQCSGIFCCGRLGEAYFLEYGAKPDSLFRFPYEPDYGAFERLPEGSIADARRKFGLDPRRRRLLYSGRLVAVKRVDLLLDAFSQIARERSDWDLVVAGAGPLQSELQSRAEGPLRDRVKWLGFIDDQAELRSLYGCADVLALPSDCEPWGVAVTEAAAASLALVCSSAVGAAADVLQDGVNGRLFPAGDLSGLAAALRDVTAAETIGRMRAASPRVLAGWREAADPVRELRRALEFAGLLPAAATVAG